MQGAVRAAGVKTVVSFVLHWNPSLINTRNLIDRGAVGRPYYIEVDYWHGQKRSYPQYPWSVTKEQGGSSLLSAGCHAVDALRWFAGVENEVVEVSAHAVPHRGDNPDWGYDPTTLVVCRFADGTLGKVASVLDCVMPYAFNVGRARHPRGRSGTTASGARSCFPGQTGWAEIPTILPE
jgi:predicted dehydrogenase